MMAGKGDISQGPKRWVQRLVHERTTLWGHPGQGYSGTGAIDGSERHRVGISGLDVKSPKGTTGGDVRK